MRASLASLFMFGAFISSPQASATVFFMEKDNMKAYFGGYAALDMFSDTTEGIDEIVGSSPVARPGTVAGDSGRMIFSSRTSRLAFGLLTTRGTAKIRGHIEADFLGYEPPAGAGVSEAGFYQNPTLRLRHAYFLVEDNGWSILAGQYWSLFGWQADYIPRSVSLPPVTGTLFARPNQITGSKTFGAPESYAMTLALSVSRPVQRDASTPNIDAGIKLTHGGRNAVYALSNGDPKLSGMSIALTTTQRQLSDPSFNGEKYTTKKKAVSAWAIDWQIPILAADSLQHFGNSLVIAGEFTRGSGYGDHFPRWTGNLANPTGAQSNQDPSQIQPLVDPGVEGFSAVDGSTQPVKLITWNANLQYHLPEGLNTWTTAGVAELASPNAKDLKASGTSVIYDRQRNAFVNVVHNFASDIRAGLEYALMQTRYVDGISSQNHRVQVTTWYRF